MMFVCLIDFGLADELISSREGGKEGRKERKGGVNEGEALT